MSERRMSQGKPIATGVRLTIHRGDEEWAIDFDRPALEFIYDTLHDCFVGHAPRKTYSATGAGEWPDCGWLEISDLLDGQPCSWREQEEPSP